MGESRHMAESAELAEIAALGDNEARREYFTGRPDLRSSEFAWQLSLESSKFLRIDLDQAGALASVARWLAEEVDDLAAHARALRAAANVLYFTRRFGPAVELYERSLEEFEQAGADLEAAITRSSAIGSLSHLARYDQATRYAEAARRTYEEHGDRLHLGRLEVAVGHVHSRQDRFPEAIEYFRRGLELFEEIGQPVDVATTLRNIAVCYQDLNDFHASLEAYSRARAYCRDKGLPLVGLEVEYNIAYIYYLRGEYSQAIHLFEEARRHSREQGDPHHAALCDLDLAEIFLELNLVHDAGHLAEKAFTAFGKLGMRYETAKALAYQALAAERRGDREKALECLREARESFHRQGNRVWVAMVELFQALILFADAKLEEAAVHADAAATGFSDSGVPSRTVVCEILRTRLALGFGELETARRRGLAALELAQEAGRPLLEFQAQLVVGQTAELAGDPAAALDRYQRAHQALERLRGQLPTDELKIAFADDKRAVYEGLVAVTLEQGGTTADVELAFGYVETAKSRSLSDMLAFGSAGASAPAAADNPLVGELRELRQEINWFYRQIGAEELKGGDPSQARLQQLRADVRQRERRLLRNLRRMQATDAELSSLQGSSVVDIPTLRAALPENGALIEYYIARGELYAFRLDRHTVEVRNLGSVTAVSELHRKLRFQFGKFRVGGDYMARFGKMFQAQALMLLEELHAALIRDLEVGEEIEHLVIVPHGFLHHIPFHALYDGERFLIDTLSVSYAPSATVFQLCAVRAGRADERSLVIGVPDERAPRILDEARAVAEILPNSRLLLSEEATRERLSELGDGCRFVHIATHGLYRKDNPMFSALQLGDTRLSLLDLYDLKLEAELAVLSGCGTGLSDVQGADELVGLTRGLLFAGARSVAATLWDVNDESTAEFMRHFYGSLTEEREPAGALQHAMLSLRESYPHPYYWAPFVLTGRP